MSARSYAEHEVHRVHKKAATICVQYFTPPSQVQRCQQLSLHLSLLLCPSVVLIDRSNDLPLEHLENMDSTWHYIACSCQKETFCTVVLSTTITTTATTDGDTVPLSRDRIDLEPCGSFESQQFKDGLRTLDAVN